MSIHSDSSFKILKIWIFKDYFKLQKWNNKNNQSIKDIIIKYKEF